MFFRTLATAPVLLNFLRLHVNPQFTRSHLLSSFGAVSLKCIHASLYFVMREVSNLLYSIYPPPPSLNIRKNTTNCSHLSLQREKKGKRYVYICVCERERKREKERRLGGEWFFSVFLVLPRALLLLPPVLPLLVLTGLLSKSSLSYHAQKANNIIIVIINMNKKGAVIAKTTTKKYHPHAKSSLLFSQPTPRHQP